MFICLTTQKAAEAMSKERAENRRRQDVAEQARLREEAKAREEARAKEEAASRQRIDEMRAQVCFFNWCVFVTSLYPLH